MKHQLWLLDGDRLRRRGSFSTTWTTCFAPRPSCREPEFLLESSTGRKLTIVWTNQQVNEPISHASLSRHLLPPPPPLKKKGGGGGRGGGKKKERKKKQGGKKREKSDQFSNVPNVAMQCFLREKPVAIYWKGFFCGEEEYCICHAAK